MCRKCLHRDQLNSYSIIRREDRIAEPGKHFNQKGEKERKSDKGFLGLRIFRI